MLRLVHLGIEITNLDPVPPVGAQDDAVVLDVVGYFLAVGEVEDHRGGGGRRAAAAPRLRRAAARPRRAARRRLLGALLVRRPAPGALDARCTNT